MQYRSSKGTNLKTFRRRSFVKNQRSRPIIRTSNMAHPDLIEQKMSAAEAAWTIGNDGKARVCARRAVAVAHEAWLARHAIHIGRWDAMGHLRRIHADESVPQSVREAAERLTTSVPRRDSAPFTSDPIGDERRIIAHLAAG